ncbi:hypothetical protein ACFYXJ_21375 [Streptomyces sp. NPDC002667]
MVASYFSRAALIPYEQPMSSTCGTATSRVSRYSVMILANHGLACWGTS